MHRLPFQVVTRWLPKGGSEYFHTAAFPTAAEALHELVRLQPCLGVLSEGRMLKSVELLGDPRALLAATEQAPDDRLPGGPP